MTVSSSTISGNSAAGPGGGIFGDDVVEIANSILAGNKDGGSAPDLWLWGGKTTIQNNLIGDNRGTGLSEAPVGSPDVDGNLIGGPVGGVIDPRLGPLTDNGGVTPTHALLPGSPAIDAGDPLAVPGSDGVPLDDQRGESYSRVVDGNGDGVARIDMGAHERQSLTAIFSRVSSPTVTPVEAVTIQFTSAINGFDLGDLELSLNGGANLLTGGETLSSSDGQTFVLSDMADATIGAGYYTLQLAPFSKSQIIDAGGGPLDSGASMSWAMGRSTLGLTVDTLLDEADGLIDDGDVSLRDAIAAAAPGETIDFDASLEGGTILLTLGELLIKKPLTIDATELVAGLVVDAAGSDPTPDVDDGQGSRIFEIDDGNSFTDGSVTIRGLTLTGGDVAGRGGAILSRETLSIESASISGNSADSGGGGICVLGNVAVKSSTISGNSARDYSRESGGGGIDSLGTVIVISSTISGNIATGPGGGIRAEGNVTVSSSIVSGNSASGRGGGINASGYLTVSSSTISANTADSDGGGGFIANGDVRITSSTISGNSAGWSGGGIKGFGEITVASTAISGNSAGGYGGGYGGGISGTGNVTVSSSTVSGNSAWRGGGIDVYGNVTVSSSTISGNSATNGPGGGISGRGKGGSVTVSSSTISGNSANGRFGEGGGGISAEGDVAVSSGTISGNSAGGAGGGGISADGGVTVGSSTVSGNSAGRGGGIDAGGNVTINSSTISDNSTDGGQHDDGGGIRAWGDVRIANSIVAGNVDNGTGPDLSHRSRGGSSLGKLSVRHSLIGDNRGTGLSEALVGAPDANGNLIGGPAGGAIDPLLGPLTDNGGVTPTHMLLPGSPAIDAGDPLAVAGSDDVPLFDQRGEPYSRIVGGRIDMGAFERGVAGDTNGDGKVDFDDFVNLANHFGTGHGWPEGNFDGSEDGTQFADFVALAEQLRIRRTRFQGNRRSSSCTRRDLRRGS